MINHNKPDYTNQSIYPLLYGLQNHKLTMTKRTNRK